MDVFHIFLLILFIDQIKVSIDFYVFTKIFQINAFRTFCSTKKMSHGFHKKY